MNTKRKCQVILLPSDEKAVIGDIVESSRTNNLGVYNKHKQYHEKVGINKWYKHNLYILSDDKIKEGDWYMNNKVIFKADDKFDEGNNPNQNKNNKKIIAATDTSLYQISNYKIDNKEFNQQKSILKVPPEFIQNFIKEWNNGNRITEVMFEYENRFLGYEDISGLPMFEKILKINKSNQISITKVKDTWNREEVIELLSKFKKDFPLHRGIQIMDFDLNNWISENL